MVDPLEILSSYSIGEVRKVRAAGGTAGKCWRVFAATGCYFLRLRGARTSSLPALEFDHGLRRHLITHGVPTAAPITTRTGETWVVQEGRAFELYSFVGGHQFRGSRGELVDTAHALARFHAAAADYPARGGYNPVSTQFAIAAPDVGGSDRFDDPVLMAAALEQRARAESGFEYAVEQARALLQSYSASIYERLPRWLIHGDYHPGNLLYSTSGRVAGIFDLDWACEHARSRDLADGIYYFATPREAFDNTSIESMTEAVELDFDSAVLFVKAYAEHAPLDPDEARAIPLALRARWLAERLEGSAKVPRERRAWFITRDLARPLQWLDAHGDEFVRALLKKV
jgi:Ser/Thr protein kinase RdoA (MazF antagonist)